jgi:superfamily II DNA or RNA helicase
MEANLSIKEFLEHYGPSLARRVTREIKVTHDPDQHPEPEMDTFLARLGITPFESQGEIIKATVKAFRSGARAVYMTAEMGAGKTLMATACALLLATAPRVLVLCPPHLVRKWIAEIKTVWPLARAINLNGQHCLAELMKLRQTGSNGRATRPEFYVIGRERAKTGWMWRPAVNQHHGEYRCPGCGQALLDKDGVPLNVFDRNAQGGWRRKHFCDNRVPKWRWDAEIGRERRVMVVCGEPLWQADNQNQRFRRPLPAWFIKNKLKGAFDLLICDEAHQYKNQSGQGWAFAALARACPFTLCLTGTLAGGYASDVFHLLFRTHPRQMVADGCQWNNPTGFMERYGVLERITTISEEDGLTTRAKKRTVVRAKPGISPLLLGNLLLPHSVFLRLADCTANLAPYQEEVIELAMAAEQGTCYRQFELEMRSALLSALACGDYSLLGSYLNALLSYPDRMQDGVTVIHPHTKELVAQGPAVDGVMPKERELLELLAKEKQAGRKVLVYIQNSLTTDISPRLVALLEEQGIKAKVLRAGDSEGREAKIKKWVAQGLDALICNPRLVETGLDLLDFPSIIFYQTGYSTYTLRQAARRSWRIPQKQPVRVYFLCYANSMQAQAMKLMADKLTCSLALEGEISDQGLAVLSDAGDSLARELVKALVDQAQDNRELKDVWANYRRKEFQTEQPLAEPRKVKIEQPIDLPITEATEQQVTSVSVEADQIGDRVVKVTFFEVTGRRRKKVTQVEVRQGELGELLDQAEPGVVAQLGLF